MLSVSTGRLAALVACVLTSAVLVAGAPAHSTTIKPKTTGTYLTGKRFEHVGFNVVRKGKQYELVNFQISCMASRNSFGSVYSSKALTVASSGKFSYDGKAKEFGGGQPTGTATLKISGRFVSDTKATGSASFSKATHNLSGCPGHSFTASWVK